VQPAHFSHQFGAGAQVKVVSVGKHQAGANLIQLAGGDSFHRCLCADRGKNRGLQVSVGGVENTSPGHSLPGDQFIIKRRVGHGWLDFTIFHFGSCKIGQMCYN